VPSLAQARENDELWLSDSTSRHWNPDSDIAIEGNCESGQRVVAAYGQHQRLVDQNLCRSVSGPVWEWQASWPDVERLRDTQAQHI